MQITIKAHLNKQTRDSKKELIQFYVKGDDENRHELNMLCREVVELSMDGAESLTAEFVKKSQDSKKTILDFIVKGDTSSSHSFEFYKLAGTDVELTTSESQMSIEEFKCEDGWQEADHEDDEEEGLEVKVNPDGTVELKHDDEPEGNTPSGRTRPLTKKEKAEQAANEDDLPE